MRWYQRRSQAGGSGQEKSAHSERPPEERRCGSIAWILIGALASFNVAASPHNADLLPFGIDDYFGVRCVVELALSADGSRVAYSTEILSLQENRTVRELFVQAAAPGARVLHIRELRDAASVAWVGGADKLAFLDSRGGDEIPQVFSYDVETKLIEQHTASEAPVIAFAFASDGESLAWLTKALPDGAPASLYKRLWEGASGVVIDPDSTVLYHFLNPERPDFNVPPEVTLWIRRSGRAPTAVPVPGAARSFHWSSDADKLSVVYVAERLRDSGVQQKYTSMGVFDAASGTFRTLLQARPASDGAAGRFYFGGEWVPENRAVFARRFVERDLWNSDKSWARVSLETGETTATWRDLEIYPETTAFQPQSAQKVYVNPVVNARGGLYRVTHVGLEPAALFEDLAGSMSQLDFSSDFTAAVFVNQSLVRPAEIYLWRAGEGVTALTRMNEEIAGRRLPEAQEVSWRSRDGTTVYGWLLTPPGETSAERPWPMLTMIHGGPGRPVQDEFAFYFRSDGGWWPYPFGILALQGIAVFMPNYRGSESYGVNYGDPSDVFGEPVEDVISGVDHLIAEGIADAERLGIAGHSHGSGLGSIIMVRDRRYRAASFAEGSQNAIVNYSLMPGALNREVHDVVRGASLYDNPQLYIAQSSDLHFQGLDTAVLFEAGVKSLAIAMMGSPKAARRAGMPSEFIVYPRTAHNIRLPLLRRESAERNLDWFRFWLQDYEDPDPTKAEQYARWRAMGENAQAEGK